MYTFTYIYICIHTCMCIYIKCMICICIWTCKCICICIRMYVYTHTCTRRYVCIYIPVPGWVCIAKTKNTTIINTSYPYRTTSAYRRSMSISISAPRWLCISRSLHVYLSKCFVVVEHICGAFGGLTPRRLPLRAVAAEQRTRPECAALGICDIPCICSHKCI